MPITSNESGSSGLAEIQIRYEQERKKRLRDDGNAQYIEVAKSPQHEHFVEDPWVEPLAVKSIYDKFPNQKTEMLIIGAGWGGIQNAVRMVEAGISPDNIRIIDPAAQEIVWDDKAKEWSASLTQRRGGQSETLKIRSKFVTIAAGVLNWPKLPSIPGILDYQGDMFHSARWAYNITGGSPKDPSLTKLKDKQVLVVGTGATAVQIIPHLAKWCKHLYVVQRSPASVGVRDQRETGKEWFYEEVANSKGWQRERIRNFHQHFTLEEPPSVNLVDDGWTRAPGLVGLTGNAAGPKSPEEIPAYAARLVEIDISRQQGIHARVDQEVQDPITAEKLKPWYPVWCKRPLFHDDYLKTFNRDNVTLVDTEGKGIDRMTADSVVIGDEAYEADIIIFATGFLAPPSGTPAKKADMSVIGLNGVSMSTEWHQFGPPTLHGVIDSKFPNMFLSGPQQAAASGNYRFNLDEYAKHISYILTEAKRKAASSRSEDASFALAPSTEAAEDWAMQVLMHAAPMGVAMGCTPGYFNLEGDLDRVPPEYRMILARSGLWGSGIEHWLGIIENWRASGDMEGIVVR
ncbi:uncharacterized protein N7483_012959 [Penicillium malachiteum]|uniref:uncharacterized protein n=1 Tax=Penicillium malachiteum TaxID=1324776 RepID=UPI002546F184|nr:uncharacterized protein N7483_012959 [Penicillium malachiteum]KAJ5715778.1 hypothetical protein N7483_012959 [Penicillium malachiteum]